MSGFDVEAARLYEPVNEDLGRGILLRTASGDPIQTIWFRDEVERDDALKTLRFQSRGVLRAAIRATREECKQFREVSETRAVLQRWAYAAGFNVKGCESLDQVAIRMRNQHADERSYADLVASGGLPERQELYRQTTDFDVEAAVRKHRLLNENGARMPDGALRDLLQSAISATRKATWEECCRRVCNEGAGTRTCGQGHEPECNEEGEWMHHSYQPCPAGPIREAMREDEDG